MNSPITSGELLAPLIPRAVTGRPRGTTEAAPQPYRYTGVYLGPG
ncbi:hypothetical protein AB0N50_38730 [Streptomyces pharetrae]